MNFQNAAIPYVVAGMVLANGITLYTLRSGAKAASRAALYVGVTFLWVGAAFVLDDGLLRAARPWHAIAVTIALFVVFGFPAYVASRIAARAG